MLWSYCRTVFSVEQRPHESQLEQGEQAVLDGTSKWECKIQVTGTKATVTASGKIQVTCTTATTSKWECKIQVTGTIDTSSKRENKIQVTGTGTTGCTVRYKSLSICVNVVNVPLFWKLNA